MSRHAPVGFLAIASVPELQTLKAAVDRYATDCASRIAETEDPDVQHPWKDEYERLRELSVELNEMYTRRTPEPSR